jgi:23S rRNA (guanosine2251-2'-O)-methyltransferase
VKRIVYGQNPVRELVTARPQGVSVVYLAPGAAGPAARELVDLCKNRRVAYEERERHELDALAGAEARHQGVLAITGEFVYAELGDVLDAVDDRRETALFVVLDSVQDPHNLGAVVRSAHVLGAQAVIIGKDRAAPITPAAVKASAGATEHLPIVRVTNVSRAVDELKEHGIWTVAAVTAADAPVPGDVDLKGPIALVLGAEGKGLRPLVEKTCDLKVRIPMSGRVASLNVSAAAAILLYEAARQRAASQ